MFSGTVARALDIVCVSSHSFRVRTVHPLFFWIPYYVRKVLKNFENCSQPAQPVGKPDHQFIRLCFSEQQLGHFSLFGSVLTHPELESHTVAFFGFLTI